MSEWDAVYIYIETFFYRLRYTVTITSRPLR